MKRIPFSVIKKASDPSATEKLTLFIPETLAFERVEYQVWDPTQNKLEAYTTEYMDDGSVRTNKAK